MRTLYSFVLVAAAGLAQAPPTPPNPPAPPNQRTIVIAHGGSFLGVGIQEVDSERAKTLKLREEAGVEITSVEANSPADKAGLKTGDVVTEYNGQRVEGLEQFSRMVRETPSGRDARIGIVRNGVTQTVIAKVGARSAGRASVNGNINGPFNFNFPDIPTMRMSSRSAVLGVEAERVDGQLAQFFGAKEGVLVRSVVMGSAAEKAGIKTGDIITKVGEMSVTTPASLTGQLRSQAGKTVPVTFIREKREMTVTVTLDQDNRGRNQPRVLRRRAEADTPDANGDVL